MDCSASLKAVRQNSSYPEEAVFCSNLQMTAFLNVCGPHLISVTQSSNLNINLISKTLTQTPKTICICVLHQGEKLTY